MMAFIDNDLTVLCDEILHPGFIVSALDNGNIDTVTRIALASANLANCVRFNSMLPLGSLSTMMGFCALLPRSERLLWQLG